MPDAVARISRGKIADVLAMANLARGDVLIDFRPPDPEHRPHETQRNPLHCALAFRAHPTKTCPACTAKEIEEKSLHLIVGMMGQNHRATAAAFCNRGKKPVTGFARGSFNRPPFGGGEGGHVGSSDLAFQPKPSGQCRHKTGISR